LTPDDYFKQLEDTILRNQELEKENEELKNKMELLEKENEDLKKRLLFYENPNTPPSERTIQKADKTSTENIPVPKKRGAPIGHKGATRPTKEPENTKEVIADHCEKCNSPNIEKLDKCETSIIEDMPPPQKITITQYNRWEVKCLDCGHQFMSKDPECRDFLLSSGLKNHREHRGHREKRHRSVLSVYSVVDQLCSDSFFQNKLKSI
jgi:hypothetical protein